MLDRLGRLAVPAAMALGSVLVALTFGECALRVALPQPDGYFVYPPGLRQEFEPASEMMPGVEGISRFVVNSLGLRGDELVPEHETRILALGGSTTQCLYLDQSEAWPQRVQDLLSERWHAPGRIWVGNAGKAGRRLPEHRLQLEHLLPTLEDLDVLLMLVGANDVNRRLNEDVHYAPPDPDRPEVRAELLSRAFDVHPWEYAWLPPQRSALWTLVERGVQALKVRRHWQMIQDRRGSNYQLWRRRRAEASAIRTELPDLRPALEAYRSDLEAVRALADRHGVRLVFLTQPYVYREDLTEEERALLWMGWIGERQSDRGQEYYSPVALARAYDAFNATLLRFCRETGTECIDLEPRLPKDTRSFYDDIHFNEEGADRVAQVVAGYLSGGEEAESGGEEPAGRGGALPPQGPALRPPPSGRPARARLDSRGAGGRRGHSLAPRSSVSSS